MVPWGRWPWKRLDHSLGRGAVRVGIGGGCDSRCGGGVQEFFSCNCGDDVLNRRVVRDAASGFRRPCGRLRALD